MATSAASGQDDDDVLALAALLGDLGVEASDAQLRGACEASRRLEQDEVEAAVGVPAACGNGGRTPSGSGADESSTEPAVALEQGQESEHAVSHEGHEEDEEEVQEDETQEDGLDAAALAAIAQHLPQQIQAMSEEMNRMHEQLYGENGLGRIERELADLKADGVCDLLRNSPNLGELLERRRDMCGDQGRRSVATDLSGERDGIARQSLLERRRRLEKDLNRSGGDEDRGPVLAFFENLFQVACILLVVYFASIFWRHYVRGTANDEGESFDSEL